LTLHRARRLAPAILVGVALAGSLWFGLIPLIVRLHLQHRLPTIDSRLVDLGVLLLNAALLAAFVTIHRFRSRPSGPHEASR
jgi:hypothetical protein